VVSRVAATMASVPSPTVWVPWWSLRSVAVKPRSTTVTSTSGRVFAYMIETMFSAAFDAG
jgi:hypothetical protein